MHLLLDLHLFSLVNWRPPCVSFHVSQISAFFLHQVLKLIENNIFNGINIMLLSRCLMTSFQTPKEGILDALLKSEILFFYY